MAGDNFNIYFNDNFPFLLIPLACNSPVIPVAVKQHILRAMRVFFPVKYNTVLFSWKSKKFAASYLIYINSSFSKGKKEASWRSNEKHRLDAMSSPLEVSRGPTDHLSVGWCCGGLSSQLEVLAELRIFWDWVYLKGKVGWAWQQLRAFARNKPISK